MLSQVLSSPIYWFGGFNLLISSYRFPTLVCALIFKLESSIPNLTRWRITKWFYFILFVKCFCFIYNFCLIYAFNFPILITRILFIWLWILTILECFARSNTPRFLLIYLFSKKNASSDISFYGFLPNQPMGIFV